MPWLKCTKKRAVNEDMIEDVDPSTMEKSLPMLEKPEYRRKLSKLGLERAQEFSWKKTAEQTLAVYQDALQLGRSAKTREPGS